MSLIFYCLLSDNLSAYIINLKLTYENLSDCEKQISVTGVKSVFSNTSQHVASFQSCAKNSPAPAIPEYLYYKANPKAGKQQTFP
jgi:hypothetical protein